MKIVFLTNYINHHQAPLADELYRLEGVNYIFIATKKIYEWRKNLGYPDFSDRPYLLNAYESKEKYAEAINHINDADVVIVGSAPEIMIKERLKLNKLTFRYAERYFKERPWYFPDPRIWFYFFKNHTLYRNKNIFMLAASAYTANDLGHFYAYPNKIFKWGYFPSVPENLIRHNSISNDNFISRACYKTRLMWCSRFIEWKHPELPILLANKLKIEGYNFHLDMYGIGEMMDDIKRKIENLHLQDVVTIQGSKPNSEILESMCEHDIFLFTSDKTEGWGAVLNEAMGHGCAVVASNEIGAVPFLVKNGKNGLIFKSNDLESLYNNTKLLLDDRHLQESVSQCAIQSMRNLWSPRIAANRFLILVDCLLKGEDTPFKEGPCSKANPIKKNFI